MSKIFYLIMFTCLYLQSYTVCFPKKLHEEDIATYFEKLQNSYDDAFPNNMYFSCDIDNFNFMFINKDETVLLPDTMHYILNDSQIIAQNIQNNKNYTHKNIYLQDNPLLLTLICSYFCNFKKFNLNNIPNDTVLKAESYIAGKYLIASSKDYKYSVPIYLADIIFDEDLSLSKSSIKEVSDSFYKSTDSKLSIIPKLEIQRLYVYEEKLLIAPGKYGVFSLSARNKEKNEINLRMLIPNVSSLERIKKFMNHALQKKYDNLYKFLNLTQNELYSYGVISICIGNY